MQYIFNFAQSDLILQFLVGLLVILSVMILTTHWPKIKPLLDIKYILPVVFIAFSPLAFFAIYEIFTIVLAGVENFGNDKRGYTILLAALAGAPFVIWRTWIAQKQGVVAEQGHMTDRISKAVEQLGATKQIADIHEKYSGQIDGLKQAIGIQAESSNFEKYYSIPKTVPNLEVRLGAIYALERIGQDSPRDHISVMEILCAYVRNNAPASGAVNTEVNIGIKSWRNELRNTISNIKSPPIDIQACLSVIGRRSDTHITLERDVSRNLARRAYVLDLRNTNLQKLDLRYAKLNFALLIGAQLQGGSLNNAWLQHANLERAQLQGANLGAAQLQNISLEGAYMDETHFGGANMQYAKFGKSKRPSIYIEGVIF